jgi:aminopeptidase YwaD
MSSIHLLDTAAAILDKLCREIPGRRVGSAGNRAATDFFARSAADWGFETESPAFDCLDWSHEGADLTVSGVPFEVLVGPYSLGCQVRAPLVVASTVQELEDLKAHGKIVLLHGDLAKEQLMPKKFPFYNPEEHQRIIHLLETKKPAAIVAATTRDVGMAGAVYPFPLIEDGDVDIPSVYMTAEEGCKLARHVGQPVVLHIRAERIPSTGCNVTARRGGDPHRRVVLFAHIDAKEGTPGALDNATGVAVLLLLAELLVSYSGALCVEIVALNGEDYYSGPGEQLWLSMNAGRFEEIVLGVNLDGAGYHQGSTAYSLYDCPVDITKAIHDALSPQRGFVEGEPWYQSDHGLFLMHQRPALAITSDRFTALWSEIAHTQEDKPEIVDYGKLVAIAEALRDLLLHLDQLLG